VSSSKEYFSGKLGYVSIPLTMVYYPTERLGIELGPQISFLNKHAVKNTKEFISVLDNFMLNSYTDNNSLDSNTTKTEFAFNVGLSFKVLDHVQFSARYGYSLTDLIKENESIKYATARISAKNTFQMNLGILF
jgi:opacity protein-like surface antigen